MRRKRPGRWTAVAAVAAAFTLLGAIAWAAEVLTVIEREAAVRKDKRTYSPKVATVKEGEKVTLIAKEPPWLRVSFKGVEGWLNETSVTEDEDVVLSGQTVASGVKPTEQSAAKRGFSPEVEKEYRKENPNLEAAFKIIDDIVKGWVFPDDLILKFIEAGQLVPQEGEPK
jgi:SH3 domain-containing protein